jgi:hypothetical protein
MYWPLYFVYRTNVGFHGIRYYCNKGYATITEVAASVLSGSSSPSAALASSLGTFASGRNHLLIQLSLFREKERDSGRLHCVRQVTYLLQILRLI